MTVIANAGLVLKDSQGNKGIVKSFTDNDIDKISNAITDVGQVVDPATHMPIEATTASVGVVQLATAQDIKDGTANKVVDAKELADVVTKIKYAGSANLNNPFSLFEPKWYPMKISNLSWILSDGSWYDGDIYIGAYNKLVEAYENGTDKSDTIGGVTVSYRLSSDGLRVTTDKSSVDSLYSATGTAWYFVIDTTNKKFVLPRSKAFMQFGDEPGKFTEAGLPNIQGSAVPRSPVGDNVRGVTIDGFSGCLIKAFSNQEVALASLVSYTSSTQDIGIQFDASRSSSIYKDGVTTVQPNSVTGYLYFYVGDIERDANIINVQELVADLNDQLARFSAAAGENINAVGTPTVTYNDGTFTFNYLKGEKGDKGDKGDTPDTANYANSAGNADTVDGSHAWQMQTLAADGSVHGGAWQLQCQHNVDGDSYFKLYCGDKSVGTKVDRASSAGWADTSGRVRTQSHTDWYMNCNWDGSYFQTDCISNDGSRLPINVQKANYADSAGSVAWDNVSDKPSSYTPASHIHDDRYYTEGEIDTKLSDLFLKVYPVGSIYISANSTNPGTLFGGTWKALDQGRVLIGANSTYAAGTTGGEFTHTITAEEMPSHTHSGSTGYESSGHTHSGSTGWQSADHVHGFSGTTSYSGDHGHSAWTDSQGWHQHNSGHGWYWVSGITVTGGTDRQCLANGYIDADAWSENVTSGNGSHGHNVGIGGAGNHAHTYSGTTGGVSANHYHDFTTGGVSANHTHSFTTGASGSGWAMNNMQPYLAVYMWQRTA